MGISGKTLLSTHDRRMRWKQFMMPDGGVRRMRIVQYEAGRLPKPYLWPDMKKERIEWMVRDYAWQLEQASWLDDDKIPHARHPESDGHRGAHLGQV